MPIPLQIDDSAGRKIGLHLVEDSPLFPSHAPVAHLRQPAFLWQRALAHGLDLGIVAGLAWIVSVALALVLVQTQGASVEATTLTMVAKDALVLDLFGFAQGAIFLGAFVWLTALYFVGLVCLRSATLGQALLGLELESSAGGAPSFRQVFMRLAISSLGFLTLGLLLVPGLARQQGCLAMDYWSGTRLTRASRRNKLAY